MGRRHCREYMRSDKNKTEPEKAIPRQIPRTSTVKKETKPISVYPQKDEAEPRIVYGNHTSPRDPYKRNHR